MGNFPETRAKPSKPGIRAVAEHVALSPSAVSLALRGSASIPAETRARVQQAADLLNYVHKPRRTRERRSFRKYVFAMDDHGDKPVMSNPFYGEVLAGAEMQCAVSRASLSFCLLRAGASESTLLHSLLRNDMDGILLVGPYPPSLVARIRRATPAPMVLVDNWFAGCEYDSVMADDFAGGYHITQHLLELGHARILPLFRSLAKRPAEAFLERLRGYQTAMRTRQLEALAPVFFPDEPHGPQLIQRIAALLRDAPPFTALFCANDTFALFALQALELLDRPAPRCVSVTGYDDLVAAQGSSPTLSTVHNHPREMGAAAVRRLAERLNGDAGPVQHIRLGVSLVARESTRLLSQHEPLA
jgi:LacI family transcriptional regulator